MTIQQTRRALLAGASTLVATVLAGCSALPGYGPESVDRGPDAGKDSFGIAVGNDTEETYSVTVTARPRGDDPFFEETVESTPEEDHEWDGVLTGEGLFVVEAAVDTEHLHEAESQTQRTVVVGTENARVTEDVWVHLWSEAEGVVLEVDMDWDR